MSIDRNTKAYLPYYRGVSEKVGKVLRRKGIKSVFRPPPKIKQLLGSPKDKIPLNTPGVYKVPCDCGRAYIGETKRSVHTRFKEHLTAIRNNEIGNSSIAEHLDEQPSHYIRFDQAKIISKDRFYIPRLVREAIEIKKTPNFNKQKSFMLNKIWDPILSKLATRKSANIKNIDSVSSFCTNSNINNSNNSNNNNNNNTHSYNLRRRR